MDRLTRIDAPDTITDSTILALRTNAGLIVYAPPGAASVDVTAYAPVTDAALVAATSDRSIRGRPYACAVFLNIGAGDYEVSVTGTALQTAVRLSAGQITQIDWRQERWPMGPAHERAG